ncbi:FaeA/PapI family transcriptional regulator, partial [Escherichia coli]
MSSQPDLYEIIIKYMTAHNALLSPLTTREIADGCGISVYVALHYLQMLSIQNIVEFVRTRRVSWPPEIPDS